MPEAVRTYLAIAQSDRAWLLDRFVCPADRLGELAKQLIAHGLQDRGESLDVTVIGAPVGSVIELKERIKADREACRQHSTVMATGYEIRLLDEIDVAAAAKALNAADLGEDGLDLYVELGWTNDLSDRMHEVIENLEDGGMKARTGGVTADAFPTAASLAVFIYEIANVDVPFKFTAGLHQPIRYLDSGDNAHHHGFLNVMAAAALAIDQDLNRREIEEILLIEDANEFQFGEEGFSVLGKEIDLDGIDSFWDVFGGFGSCSVDEPLEGLVKLGLAEASR